MSRNQVRTARPPSSAKGGMGDSGVTSAGDVLPIAYRGARSRRARTFSRQRYVQTTTAAAAGTDRARTTNDRSMSDLLFDRTSDRSPSFHRAVRFWGGSETDRWAGALRVRAQSLALTPQGLPEVQHHHVKVAQGCALRRGRFSSPVPTYAISTPLDIAWMPPSKCGGSPPM